MRTMNRLLGGAAALGLAMVGLAAVLFAMSEPRWAATMFAAGSLGVMAYLVASARGSLREVRTVKSNLNTGWVRLHALSTSMAKDQSRRLEGLERRAAGLATDLGEAMDSVRAGVSDSGRHLDQQLTALARDVSPLRNAPGVVAWQDLEPRRREGVCCLVAGRDDVAAILAGADSPSRFEAWTPSAGAGPDGVFHPPGPTAPATPPHAVGAVLVDLDLVAGLPLDHPALRSFLAWLRPEVPVAGYTRVPGLASVRAAHLGRISDGLLLPVPVSGHVVRYARHTEAPRGLEPVDARGSGGPGEA